MKEDKLSCARCKAEALFNWGGWGNLAEEMHRLEEMQNSGWVNVGTTGTLGNFTLCPHCVHELKQFLAGHATSTVKEVR